MRNLEPEPELFSLLSRYDAAGGIIDYVFLEAEEVESSYACHRAAALAGMAEIDRRLERRAVSRASDEFPIEMFFRLRWDEAKLKGGPVGFTEFWGTDEERSIPEVDGYKTAFFNPPHSMSGSAAEKQELFNGINRYVLGDDPESAEILSWSTDWSNYFEAGNEWWGAFFWTVRPFGSKRIAVVGASSTD
jgi:hypothetical protein